MLNTPSSGKTLIRARVLRELEKDSVIHSFSSAAQKLMTMVRQDVDLSEIAEVVKMEPGLTSKVLRLSNSAIFGAGKVKNVEEAIFRIGMSEVRKMAMAVGIIDRVSHLRVKVDWNLFWLHSLVTARVTEALAAAYRDISGLEYLSGLLHDVGKLYMEHSFAREFENVVMRATERSSGMYEAENSLLDITHAEVSALLCEKWKVDPEISRSVRFHHEPNSPFNKDPLHPEEQRLLATCICVADSLANMAKANIQGARRYTESSLETLPEWKLLQAYPALRSLDLDLGGEIEKANAIIQAFDPSDAPLSAPPAKG